MFALALTLITPQVVNGDRISFDLENGDSDISVLLDDEVNEETSSYICGWQDGKYSQRECQWGVKRELGHWGGIDFPDGTFTSGGDYYVQIYGSDALWVDRFLVRGDGVWEYWIGNNNHHGWCLSTDRNDHLDWNHDGYSQHVTAGQCYYKLRLSSNGSVWGWWSNQALMCRTKKKMNCKQDCPSGWKHISTSDHGCCKSWSSCGGNRKTCQGDEECRRRRIGAADADVSFEVLPQSEEDGHWVLLSGQGANNETRADLADRLSQAELPEAVTDEITETGA